MVTFQVLKKITVTKLVQHTFLSILTIIFVLNLQKTLGFGGVCLGFGRVALNTDVYLGRTWNNRPFYRNIRFQVCLKFLIQIHLQLHVW